jgi:hypothetical protein
MKTRRLRKTQKRKRKTRKSIPKHLLQKGGRRINLQAVHGDLTFDFFVDSGITATNFFRFIQSLQPPPGVSPYDLLIRQVMECPPWILRFSKLNRRGNGIQSWLFHSCGIVRGDGGSITVYETYDGGGETQSIFLAEGDKWVLDEEDTANEDQCGKNEDPENDENDENGICFDLYRKNDRTGVYDIPIDIEICVENGISAPDIFIRLRDFPLQGTSPYSVLAVYRNPGRKQLWLTQPDGQFLLADDQQFLSFAIWKNYEGQANVVTVYEESDVTDETGPAKVLSTDNPAAIWLFTERDQPAPRVAPAGVGFMPPGGQMIPAFVPPPPPAAAPRGAPPAPPVPAPGARPLDIMLYRAIMKARGFFGV